MKRIILIAAIGLMLSGCTINHYNIRIENSNVGTEPPPIIIPEGSEILM